ncbi:MAG: hypothetical protein AAF827_02780 [Cyanobacteria bacterium P01_D01_bin.6]
MSLKPQLNSLVPADMAFVDIFRGHLRSNAQGLIMEMSVTPADLDERAGGRSW